MPALLKTKGKKSDAFTDRAALRNIPGTACMQTNVPNEESHGCGVQKFALRGSEVCLAGFRSLPCGVQKFAFRGFPLLLLFFL